VLAVRHGRVSAPVESTAAAVVVGDGIGDAMTWRVLHEASLVTALLSTVAHC